MTHLREHVRLALEPRAPLPIAAELLGEYLDRDVAFQPGVMGPVHLTHTPCPNARNDLAASEPGPRFQRHGEKTLKETRIVQRRRLFKPESSLEAQVESG
jgi:hypothetical protein